MNDEDLDALLDAELEAIGTPSLESEDFFEKDVEYDGARSVICFDEDDPALLEAWGRLKASKEEREETLQKFKDDFGQLLHLAECEQLLFPEVQEALNDMINLLETEDEMLREHAIETQLIQEEEVKGDSENGVEKQAAEASNSTDDFLERMQKEMQERECERERNRKEMELERERRLEEETIFWKQTQASIVIQKILRGHSCRHQKRKRRGAVSRIQSAMKTITNRIMGLRFRRKLQQERAIEHERSTMEKEDLAMKQFEKWLHRNNLRMREEDAHSRLAFVLEDKKIDVERRLMHFEDEWARRLQTFEKVSLEREVVQMVEEDFLVQTLRDQELAERRGMEVEDEAAKEFIRQISSMFQERDSSLKLLFGEKLSDIRDAKLVLNGVKEYVAKDHAFARVCDALPDGLVRDCNLERLDMRNNRLELLSGLQDVKARLTHLNLSGNQLDSQACKAGSALAHLKELKELNLSRNPLGCFDGSAFLHPKGELTMLDLSNCSLKTHPTRLRCEKLEELNLNGNEIRGPGLLDSTCLLPSLYRLCLAENRIEILRQRSAHICPKLEDLELQCEGLEEKEVLDCLFEHIFLKRLELYGCQISKNGLRVLSKYLRKLDVLNGELSFRYSYFENEIIKLQAAIRGAKRRMQVEKALDRSRFPECSEDELEEVDLETFIPEIDERDFDLDPEPVFFEIQDTNNVEQDEAVDVDQSGAIAAEWGFKESKTAKSYIRRQKKTLKGKHRQQRMAQLADPMKRCEALMKKVSKTQNPSKSNIRSVNNRDRVENSVNRRKQVIKNIPAWMNAAT